MDFENKANFSADTLEDHLLETLHLIRESSAGENYPSKISERTDVSNTAINNRADELENKGLIKQINKGNKNSKTFLELTEEGEKEYRRSLPLISDYNLEEEIKEFESFFKRKPTKKELENKLGAKIPEEELLNLEYYKQPSEEAIDKADQLVKYLLMEKIQKKIFKKEKRKNKDCIVIGQEREKTREKFDKNNIREEINRLENLGKEEGKNLDLEDFNLEENSVSAVDEEESDIADIETKAKTKTVSAELPEPWKSYFSSKEGIEDFYYIIIYKSNLNRINKEIDDNRRLETNMKLLLDKYLPWREQKPIRTF